MPMSPDIESRMHELINACKNNFESHPRWNSDGTHYAEFDIRPGQRFTKIFARTQTRDGWPNLNRGGWSCWCFIENETGDVYKPASTKAPAKGVRYKLMDNQSYLTCLKCADVFGSFLYRRSGL